MWLLGIPLILDNFHGYFNFPGVEFDLAPFIAEVIVYGVPYVRFTFPRLWSFVGVVGVDRVFFFEKQFRWSRSTIGAGVVPDGFGFRWTSALAHGCFTFFTYYFVVVHFIVLPLILFHLAI